MLAGAGVVSGALNAAGREGRALLADSCEEVAAVARAEGLDLGSEAVERTLRFAGTFLSGWRS